MENVSPTLESEMGDIPIHPDFQEYLSILLLEDEEELSVKNVSERIRDLIEPARMTVPMQQTIITQVNRRLIELAIPNPPTPKEKNTMPTTQFLNQIDKGCLYAQELLEDNHEAVVDILNFVKKISNRKRGKIRVPSKVREIMKPISNSPTTFSSFLVSLLTHCLGQITAEDLNATYQFVTGRKHNYTKPRQVLEHAEKTHWKETYVIFREDLEDLEDLDSDRVGIEEAPQNTELNQLHQTVQNLLGMVEKQSEQIQYLSSIVLTNQQAPNENNKVSFSMDKEELLQYLIQNNKLNLTIN